VACRGTTSAAMPSPRRGAEVVESATVSTQVTSPGRSVDWSRVVFTMDARRAKQ
jgi:hypothetical protein